MNGLMALKNYVSGGEVNAIYQDLFGRDADPGGLLYYSNLLKDAPLDQAYRTIAGGASGADAGRIGDINARIAAAQAGQMGMSRDDAISAVTSIYNQQLGRNPDSEGLNFYVDKLLAGESLDRLTQEIDRSTEGYNYDLESLNARYRNQFGRNLDQEGLQYYMGIEDLANQGFQAGSALDQAVVSGARGTDVAALKDRPDVGYTQIQTPSLTADPYAGAFATVNPYLFSEEAAAEVPTDVISTTPVGQRIVYTSPVTNPAAQSYFNPEGEFVFSPFESPVAPIEQLNSAINLAVSSGALSPAAETKLRTDLDNATTVDEYYEALNTPQANVVLNTVGAQIGEDAVLATALAESEARNTLAQTVSDTTGGLYPSTREVARVAEETGADFPFTSKALGEGVFSTMPTKESVRNSAAVQLGAYTAPYDIPTGIAGLPAVQRADILSKADIALSQQAQKNAGPLLRRSGVYPGLLTDVYRPQLRPEIRTPDGKLISARPAAGVGELISLESKTRYGLPSTQESRGAQAMQPIAPYLGASVSAPTNVNQAGIAPTGYVIDPATGRVIFSYQPSPTGGAVNAGTAGTANARPGEGIAGVTFTDTPDMGAGTPMPTPITETNLVGGQGTTPSIMFTPMGGNLVSLAGVGLDSTFPASPSRSEGILGAIIGEQKPAPIVTATPIPVPTEEDKQEQDNPTTEGKYAGGPVMGSPQYFEEGGKVEPMRKYTPSELGSTFDISEYIDPETGRFMINEYRRDVVFGKGLEEAETEARAGMTPDMERMMMRDLMIRQGRTGREYDLPGITVGGPATSGIRPLNYYAEGGVADIARKGYAEELRQQGRNGDTILAHINPTEAKMLEAMGGSGTINPRTGLPEYGFSWKKLFRLASKVVPFVLPGPAGAVAAGALAGASTPGKTFDFKRGLQTGIMTYAGGKLGEKVGAEFGSTTSSSLPGNAAFQAEVGLSAPPTLGQQITSALPDVSKFVPEGVTINPTTLGQAYGATASDAAAEEAIKIQQQQQAFFDEEERRRKNFAQIFQEGAGNIQPLVYARRGGLMALAGGGAIDPVGYEGGGMTAPVNQPRMLAGGGDGMSDSIPATIDGTQPARLADGEFVIPADVVADIGNGSSSAGAKRLYGMMDRVRQSRHGTTKQPPEIKMNRLMPA